MINFHFLTQMHSNRPKGLYILDQEHLKTVYAPREQEEIASLVDIDVPPQTSTSVGQNPSLLKEVEFIFSGWGAPIMDEPFLMAAPKLRAVFYAAGSIRCFTTEAFWKRGIRVTCASAVNAQPVAEYTLGAILLSLKHFWRHAANAKANKWRPADLRQACPGAYRSTIGLVSFGMIARKTLELLRPFDLQCIVYCPLLTEEEARSLNVESRSLEEVFQQSDVISLHTPHLPETRGMITGRHFALMKHGATFINTARGIIVREEDLINILRQRPDLTAILDVTWPEPPSKDSALPGLPNVVLTPHIAGSMGNECGRMGRFMVDELRRYLNGMPMEGEVTQELATLLA